MSLMNWLFNQFDIEDDAGLFRRLWACFCMVIFLYLALLESSGYDSHGG